MVRLRDERHPVTLHTVDHPHLPERLPAVELLRHRARQPGTAVVFDMDHTEGTYAVAELLHALFDRVVIAAKVGKTGAASSAAGVAAQAKAGAANRGAA